MTQECEKEHSTLQGNMETSGDSSDVFPCVENSADYPTYPHQSARLKKRKQFTHVADGGRKAIASTLVVQGAVVRDGGAIQVGFTVTKKAGNSVVRNRIRRRLRAAVAESIGQHGVAGWDYVVIGRNTALDAPYETILRDMRYALRKVSRLDDPNPHSGADRSASGKKDRGGKRKR